MKADYIATVHIKGHARVSHKLMKDRLEHYLNYWLHNDVEFFNVVRVIRKEPRKK